MRREACRAEVTRLAEADNADVLKQMLLCPGLRAHLDCACQEQDRSPKGEGPASGFVGSSQGLEEPTPPAAAPRSASAGELGAPRLMLRPLVAQARQSPRRSRTRLSCEQVEQYMDIDAATWDQHLPEHYKERVAPKSPVEVYSTPGEQCSSTVETS